MDIAAVVNAEISAINRVFREHLGAERAGTCGAWTAVYDGAFVAYGIKRAQGVEVGHVTKLHRELNEAISNLRRRTTPVRLRYMPLALEVDHPTPKPLAWRNAMITGKYDTMLVGRNYNDGAPRDEVLSFDDTPHVLIAGTTGSGKSTLMRMALCSLAMRTDPDALRLYLVDLKEHDLVPFNGLPHREAFATEQADAQRVIRTVYRELQRRKGTEHPERLPRLVVAIDELAEVGDKETLEMLASILRIGRSYRVNVIAATQLPTKATCGEKNNYTVRFVGAVTDPGTAAVAAGRGETGAHLLPGRGAFLRVEGNKLERLQAYHLDMDGTAALVASIRQRWPGRDGVVEHMRTGGAPVHREVVQMPVHTGAHTGASEGIAVDWPIPVKKEAPATSAPVEFPLPRNRPPSPAEALALRQLYAETGSKNQTCIAAYGTKSSLLMAYVGQALNEGGAA